MIVALVAAVVCGAFLVFLEVSNRDDQAASPGNDPAAGQAREPTREAGKIANASILDGRWKAGLDFRPGTYRAPGGDGCYFALLGSASDEDIVENGFGDANPTVAITSPWFETQDCGVWRKIE